MLLLWRKKNAIPVVSCEELGEGGDDKTKSSDKGRSYMPVTPGDASSIDLFTLTSMNFSHNSSKTCWRTDSCSKRGVLYTLSSHRDL